MSSIITVHAAIALASASLDTMVFTNADTGMVYRSRHTDKCMMFDAPGRQPLTQGQFLTANRYSGMTQSGEFEEPALEDSDGSDDDEVEGEPAYPELEDAIAWANDPDTDEELLQSYLADVAGEDDRKRKRETHVAKIVEYVTAQL